MNLITIKDMTPKVHPSVFVAHGSSLIGDVEVGPGSSIWYNVVIRGDVMPIRIGSESNIQDGSVLHGTYQKFGTTIEDRVTIGHLVMLHGCHIGRGTLVGMGSIIMDGCQIGEHCIIGAGTLLTEGTVIPPRSLVVGRPGKVKRGLTETEIKLLEHSADNYLLYKSWYEPTF